MSRLLQLILGFFSIVIVCAVALLGVGQITADSRAGSVAPTRTDVPGSQEGATGGDQLTARNCRYGVATFRANDLPFLEQLDVGWAINFSVNFNASLPAGTEYVPVIRMKQARDNGSRLPDYVIMTQPLTDDPGGLGPLILSNPGRLWMVGNEVDRVFWQDDIMPDIYAKAYHDIYHFIKDRDPTAQVAISGLVEVTPGRLQYLDIVWDTYLEKYGTAIPVDVWNMHIYILPEKTIDGTWVRAAVALGTDPSLAILQSYDPDGGGPLGLSSTCALSNVYCDAEHDDLNIFAQQVTSMRQWMKDHGQQQKPLILSEYSLLYPYDDEEDNDPATCFLRDEFGQCFTPARVSQFMENTVSYLESASDPNLGYSLDNYRLVQQWLWFAMNDGDPYTPNKLVDYGLSGAPDTFTQVGTKYKDLIATQPLDLNLLPSWVAFPTAMTITPTGSISTTVSVEIVNNGNVHTTTPFTVTFFSDASQTQVIGSVIVPAGLGGCTRQSHRASVVWNGLQTGVHRYWVEIDSGNDVIEAKENDNAANGFALINPKQLYLPIVRR